MFHYRHWGRRLLSGKRVWCSIHDQLVCISVWNMWLSLINDPKSMISFHCLTRLQPPTIQKIHDDPPYSPTLHPPSNISFQKDNHAFWLVNKVWLKF